MDACVTIRFDLHCIGFKVDGIPFQPQHFAAAQAVEGCQKDRHLQFGSICRLGQGVNLFGSVVAAFEIVLFGRSTLSAGFEGIRSILTAYFKGFVDICVIMDHGVWLDPLQLLGVEIL